MTCCGVLSTDLTTINDDFVAIPLKDKDSGFLNGHYGTRTGCKSASFNGASTKLLIWKFPRVGEKRNASGWLGGNSGH